MRWLKGGRDPGREHGHCIAGRSSRKEDEEYIHKCAITCALPCCRDPQGKAYLMRFIMRFVFMVPRLVNDEESLTARLCR